MFCFKIRVQAHQNTLAVGSELITFQWIKTQSNYAFSIGNYARNKL